MTDEAIVQNTPAPADNPAFLTSYLRYLEFFRGRSKATVASTELSLREFLQYVHYKEKMLAVPSTADAHKDMSICNMLPSELAGVTSTDIKEYLCFLDITAKNNTSTLRRKLSQLRPFFHYLHSIQEELGIQWTSDPVQNISLPPPGKPELNILTPKEITKLLNAIDGENAVRDYAMIYLILTSGIMLQELVNLNEADYNGKTISVHGPTVRTIPLTPGCIQALNRYLQEYRSPLEGELSDKALFVSSQVKRRLTCRCVQQTIKKHIRAAGLESKNFTAQDLRDTAVATILRSISPDDIPFVLDYLGYRSRDSAARFASVIPDSPGPSYTAAMILQATMQNAELQYG